MSDDKLEKGWVGAIASAAALTAGSMSPQLKSGFDRAQKVPEYAVEKPRAQFDPKTLHPDMHPIAFLETSYGKNMEHAPHQKGEFDTAYGPLGFKPSTAFDEFSKSKHLTDLYPNLKDQNAFHQEFKTNPQFYNLVAGAHWNRLKKATGSASGAAFAWRWGLGAHNKATPEAVKSDDYVSKYAKLTETQPWLTKLGKALSAEDHHYFVPQNHIEKIRSGVDYDKMGANIHQDNENSFNINVLKNPRLIRPSWKNEKRDMFGDSQPDEVNGVAPKMIFKTPDSKKWLVKPFYDDDRFGQTLDQSGKPLPPSESLHGWNEHTSQDMYHAGGLGDLIQKSHHAKHSRVGLDSHVTVIEMDPEAHDFEKYLTTEHQEGARPKVGIHPHIKNDAITQQAQKFLLMDWLTGNVDRHPQNLMVKHAHKAAGKHADSLLSIDHGFAFQPHNSTSLSHFMRHNPLRFMVSQKNSDWRPTFDWWERSSPSIEQAFNKNIGAISNPELKQKLVTNFQKNKSHLDQLMSSHRTLQTDSAVDLFNESVK